MGHLFRLKDEQEKKEYLSKISHAAHLDDRVYLMLQEVMRYIESVGLLENVKFGHENMKKEVVELPY